MAIVRRTIDFNNLPPLTAEQLEQIERLKAMTPEEIEQNALDDPDNPPWTEEEMQRGLLGRSLRETRDKMALTQAQFAERFHINLARLRDWEQGRYMPDSAALAYLKVIAREPEAVMRALAPAPQEQAAE